VKLSEAIRKGCEIVPKKCIGELFQTDDNGKVVAACAIGAAAIGEFGLAEVEDHLGKGRPASSYYVQDPLRRLLRAPSPIDEEQELSVQDWIVEQNDESDMDREEIASLLHREGF
jgi:hypothetical protein